MNKFIEMDWNNPPEECKDVLFFNALENECEIAQIKEGVLKTEYLMREEITHYMYVELPKIEKDEVV